MRVAATGHMNITQDTGRLIYDEIFRLLSQETDLVGVSCIARGADSVFARAVLDVGGQLEVILPTPGYREQKVKPDHLPLFDELISKATQVRTMDYADAGREAYEAANAALLESADLLVAVWDGENSQRAGTGTVVELAHTRGVDVVVIWPEGAMRE